MNAPPVKSNDSGRLCARCLLEITVEYEPLVITYHNGSAVRVSDVGRAVDSVEDIRNAGYGNGGKPSVMVTKDQTNMPAFQRYWPLLTYSSAVSKFGFSTNRSAM